MYNNRAQCLISTMSVSSASIFGGGRTWWAESLSARLLHPSPPVPSLRSQEKPLFLFHNFIVHRGRQRCVETKAIMSCVHAKEEA